MPISANDRVWEIMERFATALLITNGGLETRGRPMAVSVSRKDNTLYFLSDVTSDKDYEIQFDPSVVVAFVDPLNHKYAWVSGRAVIANDRARIRELWTPLAGAWWESPEDPDIRVVKVTPETANYWNGAGKIASHASAAAAALSDGAPSLAEERPVLA